MSMLIGRHASLGANQVSLARLNTIKFTRKYPINQIEGQFVLLI